MDPCMVVLGSVHLFGVVLLLTHLAFPWSALLHCQTVILIVARFLSAVWSCCLPRHWLLLRWCAAVGNPVWWFRFKSFGWRSCVFICIFPFFRFGAAHLSANAFFQLFEATKLNSSLILNYFQLISVSAISTLNGDMQMWMTSMGNTMLIVTWACEKKHQLVCGECLIMVKQQQFLRDCISPAFNLSHLIACEIVALFLIINYSTLFQHCLFLKRNF